MSYITFKKLIYTIYEMAMISAFFLALVNNAQAFNLIGTWKLISIEKQNKEKTWESDCYSPTGLLIYSASGYMAAGINCMRFKDSNMPSFNSNDITFYMGKYLIKDNKIIHATQNASDAAYYRKNLERKLQVLNKHEMIIIVRVKMEKNR